VIKLKRLRWAGHVAIWGKGRCIHGFREETSGKRPLGRPTNIWEDNIKMHLQEVGLEGIKWIELAQD
jgi:hypothetical protein